MCDPRWIYGLPINKESLCDYAREKAPECIEGSDNDATAINVIEIFERIFHQMLSVEVGYDVFDEELKSQLVLVLQEEHPKSTKLRLEDEELIRKELGIKEKGMWYRYLGAFHLKNLERYKKRVLKLGPIPSRTRRSNKADETEVCTTCGGSGRLPVGE